MRSIMRLSLVFIYVAVTLLATGCGFKDIDKRYFVVGMGIDATGNEEKPIRITIKLGVPSIEVDAGKSKNQVEIIDTHSISHGLRMIKSRVEREIDFGHCNVFLFGEEFAKSNIREAVTWMIRRRDIQKIAAVGIGSPNAEEIIKVNPAVERFPGNTLGLFFSNEATESSYTFIALLTDLFRRLNENGLDPIMPIIKSQKDSTYVINRVALLNKEKIVAVLEPDETQLLIQLLAHLRKMYIYGGFISPPYAIAVQRTSTAYNFNRTNSSLALHMNIKQKITFDEMPINAYYNDPVRTVEQIESAYSDAVTVLLEKIQQAGVDPIGFGLRYRAKYHLPNFKEEWPDIYKRLEFHVNTKMEVNGTGLLK